ncbi:winged helix-turn-helix domain-containing protein [Phenylobacterium sp.]|uniref:winged helix-turn-helix domain-containing protein n=1 Tax=Phenylobacterium sp. TaxID=1871053 RepID=UPI00395A45B4
MRQGQGNPGNDGQIGRLRLIARALAAYLLDTIAIARGDSDVVDTLLASAIIQANIADIVRHADVQVAFAEADAPPPDEMRRPVSMNALANSLNLPFETVRRRVKAMAADGFVRFVDGGVIVPTAVLADPAYAVAAFRGYERLRAFYYQLSDLGLLDDLPPPTVDLAPGVMPFRAVSRLVGTFVLRFVETVSRAGGPADALILLEIFRSNTEHLTAEHRGGEGWEAKDMADDALRKPVSVSEVARRIGMPAETVRRHVRRMAGAGWVVRTRDGIIIPAQALALPAVFPALLTTGGNLQRLFGSLSQLGVLRIWDEVRESRPPQVAAIG